MKKLFVLTALIGLSLPTFVGCGSSAPEVVEEVQEDDGSMNADMQRQYEEQMKGGGPSRSTAPKK